MTKRINREERLQVAVWQHLMLCLPEDVVAYSSAAEAGLSANYGARLKKRGVIAGVPDLTFILPGGHIAYIELKPDKDAYGDRGYLSKEQRAFRDRVESIGAWFALARSIEEVEGILSAWGVKLKGWSRKPVLEREAA